jgi:hypothetical protein
VSDRVVLRLSTQAVELKTSIDEHHAHLKDEVLAVSVLWLDTAEGQRLDVDGHALTVQLTRAQSR